MGSIIAFVLLLFISPTLSIERVFLPEEQQESLLENAFSDVELVGPGPAGGEIWRDMGSAAVVRPVSRPVQPP